MKDDGIEASLSQIDESPRQLRRRSSGVLQISDLRLSGLIFRHLFAWNASSVFATINSVGVRAPTPTSERRRGPKVASVTIHPVA